METSDKTKSVLKNKNYWTILLIFGVLITFAPWFFTTLASLGWFNFTETGTIGDTIGGITAPFVGVLGAILVYLSFTEQREANRIQMKALEDEKQRIDRQLNFEFMYRFFNEEIKNYRFPHDRDLFGLFNAMNKDFSENEDPSLFYFFDVQYLFSYVSINLFYIDEVSNQKMDPQKKKILSMIYLNNYTSNIPAMNFPEEGGKVYLLLEKHYPTFILFYKNWQKGIERLSEFMR